VNVFLWGLQILLALVMLAAGGFKLSQPRPKLAESMAWVENFTSPQVKAIAAVEVLAAIGLVLPAATGIAPVLTPLAGAGVAVIMIGAVVTHGRLREYPNIAVNVVLLVLAVVIAWGRFGAYAV
jgi:uncharacterized membrane protein YphA (DoxX/SURF4 family)